MIQSAHTRLSRVCSVMTMEIRSGTEIAYCNRCEPRKHANLHTFTVHNTGCPRKFS
jgi:hypothetical protein